MSRTHTLPMKNNNKRSYRNEFRMVFLLSEKIALTICSTTTNGASIRGVILGTKHTNEASTCWETKTPKCTIAIWKKNGTYQSRENANNKLAISKDADCMLSLHLEHFPFRSRKRTRKSLAGWKCGGGIGLFVRARMFSCLSYP